MLTEDIQRAAMRLSALQLTGFNRVAGRRNLNEFKCVSRYTGESTDSARPMPTSTRALQQASDTFRRSHLHDSINRTEIDAQIQAAGADNAFQRTCAKTVFDPCASVVFQ